MNHVSQYDKTTIETLQKYSEDFPKLESWLNSVELAVVKTGYGPAEHMPGELRFSYLVTISRNGKTCQFPYYGSVNDYWWETNAVHKSGKLYGKRKGQKPSPIVYSVLATIGGDYHCPDSHHDFCQEYGYNEDSIKDMALFTECQKLARSLRTVITADEIQAFPS